jgi:hypothetical protein
MLVSQKGNPAQRTLWVLGTVGAIGWQDVPAKSSNAFAESQGNESATNSSTGSHLRTIIFFTSWNPSAVS